MASSLVIHVVAVAALHQTVQTHNPGTINTVHLLPFFPLDGGRVLRAILSFRLHPNRATILAARIGMVGAVGLGLWGLFRGELWGTILVVTCE